MEADSDLRKLPGLYTKVKLKYKKTTSTNRVNDSTVMYNKNIINC